MANIDIVREVKERSTDGWNLCFQWCCYHYDNGNPDEMGYRFIWRDPDARLHPQRGQALIPSARHLFRLINKAIQQGWFITCEN